VDIEGGEPVFEPAFGRALLTVFSENPKTVVKALTGKRQSLRCIK